MNDLNRFECIGRLGQAPELKYTQNGDAVCNFTVACSESWKDKQGQKQERTEWVRIVAWRKLAEICGEYLGKGKQVYIAGKLQSRKWQDQNGQDRYTTEIIASEMQMLGRINDVTEEQGRRQSQTHRPDAVDKAFEDDIPF